MATARIVKVVAHNLLANGKVLLPRASIPVIPEVFLEPNLQVEGCHVMAGCLQQAQCQAAIHSPTEKESYSKLWATCFTPVAHMGQHLRETLRPVTQVFRKEGASNVLTLAR